MYIYPLYWESKYTVLTQAVHTDYPLYWESKYTVLTQAVHTDYPLYWESKYTVLTQAVHADWRRSMLKAQPTNEFHLTLVMK